MIAFKKFYLNSLVLLFMFDLCLADEMQDLIDQLHNACLEETGVEEALVSRAQKGDFADDEKLKCYTKCILDQMACVDDDGIIDIEAMAALVPDNHKDVMVPVIRKCGTKMGSSPCENIWLTNKCYFQEAPNDYFLP